jgi:hypothetical protein
VAALRRSTLTAAGRSHVITGSPAAVLISARLIVASDRNVSSVIAAAYRTGTHRRNK